MIDPQSVVERVPLLANASHVDLSPLEGGLTNKNFLVTADDKRFVLRIAGPNGDILGIDRVREAECLRRAESSAIGPQVVASFPEGHLVTRFLTGAKLLTVEEFTDVETIPRVARRLKDVHSLEPVHGSFDPQADIRRWTHLTTQRRSVSDSRFVRLRERASHVPSLNAESARCRVLCHNDPYYLNFLDDGELRLIDWEYAGMGDPLYDLAAVGYRLDSSGRDLLLASYEADPVAFSRVGLDEMIGLFLCWNAAWTLVQMEITDIDFDYPEFFEHLLGLAEDDGLV